MLFRSLLSFVRVCRSGAARSVIALSRLDLIPIDNIVGGDADIDKGFARITHIEQAAAGSR